MRIKLLIATEDAGYAEHLSSNVSQNYSDAIAVSVCQSKECLLELLSTQKYEAALLESDLIKNTDLSAVTLPLILAADEEKEGQLDAAEEIGEVIKYQRISSLIADVMARYAKVSKLGRKADIEHACITAVWSPAGGVGKTTVALSYAAKKASEGKQVLYLNLESFSSIPAYFCETGKSISSVFEMLETNEGDIKMLIRGICRRDGGAGVSYFCMPENFDDMCALSAENIAELTTVCAGVTEELVIDMSCVCDRKTRKVFELADKVLLVTDHTTTAELKLFQFASQHTVLESIKEKALLVANKGANSSQKIVSEALCLPLVKSSDPASVYKALSGSFEDCVLG